MSAQRDPNLLDLSLRHVEPPLSARRIVLAWALVAVVLLAWWGLEAFEARSLDAQEASLGTAVQAARSEITTLGQQLAARQASPALAADIEARGAAIATREAALAALERSTSTGGAGPGATLRALARQRVDGVWLTAIRVGGSDGRLALQGASLDPALIPAWLQSLGREDALRGQAFNHLELVRRPEQKAVAPAPPASAGGPALSGVVPVAARPSYVEFSVGTDLTPPAVAAAR
jgi:hypothetical protein